MATATVGALKVVLGLDSASFTDGLSGAQRHLKKAGQQMQSAGVAIATAGAAATATITTAFVGLGIHLLQGSQDAAAAAAQVNAALKSMGGASGKTADELSKTAEQLRNLTGIDDDMILKDVTANLLTFGNVAGPVFDRAQKAILDLSARLGGDLQSATLMVGKALNDPVKGLSALRRTGIQFTKQQEDQIKAMAAVGDTAGAQAIMLAELEKQFGGAAQAAAEADVWTPLKTALMDLEGAFEPIVRDVLAPAIKWFADLARSIADMSPAAQKFVAIGAVVAAALGPVLIAVGAVVSAVGTLTAAFAGAGFVAAFAAALPIIAAVAAGVAVAVGAFMLFKDDVTPVLNTLWNTLKTTLGPALGDLFKAIGAVVGQLATAFKTFFASEAGRALVQFGAAVSTILGTTVIQVLTALVKIVTTVVKAIGDGFKVLGLLLKGDFVGAWNAYKEGTARAIKGLMDAVGGLGTYVVNTIKNMVQGVAVWLTGRLFDVLKNVIGKVKGVSDAFFRLYDAVVGHSYVPDMVIEIGQWMAKLDAGMVKPALTATEATRSAFEKLRDDVSSVMERLMTDSERAARQLAQDTKKIRAAVSAGVISSGIGARLEAGAAGENLTLGSGEALTPISQDPGVQAINEAWASIQQQISDSREKFADAFEYGIDSALRGDWQGVLSAIVGSSFQDGLKSIGRSLFDAFGGGSGGGGLGSFLSSIMGSIPGFSTGVSNFGGGLAYVHGGEVLANLAPGTDVIPKREVGKLGGGSGGGVTHVVVSTNDDRFNAYVDGRVAPQSAAVFSTARKTVPSDMARTDRYTLGRRR